MGVIKFGVVQCIYITTQSLIKTIVSVSVLKPKR